MLYLQLTWLTKYQLGLGLTPTLTTCDDIFTTNMTGKDWHPFNVLTLFTSSNSVFHMVIPPKLVDMAPKHVIYISFFYQFTIQKPYLVINLTDVPIKLENKIP